MKVSEGKNAPLVSVGIFTYNRPKGLKQTLECITTQTYKNLEIIVSDNCSLGPETQQVIQAFLEADDRIVSFRQNKNIGMVNNSNFVIKKATGKYFMFAADDDEWYPQFIEKCVSVLEDNPDIIMCTTQSIIVSDVILEQRKNYPSTYTETPYYLCNEDANTVGLSPIERVKKTIVKSGTNTAVYGLYRTDLLKNMMFHSSHNPHKFGADRIFMARLNLLGPIFQIPEPLFVYHHGMGISSTNPLKAQNEISRWEYYGLRINPLLTAYLNMIFDSLSWPVSITDHIRVIGYYLARMAKAKIVRYTSKNSGLGIPLLDYMPPRYEASYKNKDI